MEFDIQIWLRGVDYDLSGTPDELATELASLGYDGRVACYDEAGFLHAWVWAAGWSWV
jgi:hypothetical protein